VALVFTANPEDYTARGKIITPLKDRIGSEIRTHYPATLDEGLAITAQEAWTNRESGKPLVIPQFMREVIEAIAFEARADKRIDKRSGVSQRMPITCMENAVSSAECRALKNNEDQVVPRPADIYASLPSLTGKLELEYEGEVRGADSVARDVIRQAMARVFKKYFDNVPLQSVVQWFEIGGTLRYSPNSSSDELFHQFKQIQNLLDKTQNLGIHAKDHPALLAAGGEFILEGLCALKRISRNEELGYHTERRPPERTEEPQSPAAPRRRPLN
jgi:magnesium chelatase subunit I